MAIEIKVPTLGESVTEATVAQWFKSTGEQISIDEPIVELETDKVTIEVPAPASGVLSEIVATEGENVEVGAVLGAIAEVAARPADSSGIPEPSRSAISKSPLPAVEENLEPAGKAKPEKTAKPVEASVPEQKTVTSHVSMTAQIVPSTPKPETKNQPSDNILPLKPTTSPAPVQKQEIQHPQPDLEVPASPSEDDGKERRVRMSRLRQTIARRLVDVQQSAALLTTFNEADMTGIQLLRKEYQETFVEKHGVKLGFMSFFVKAAVKALEELPAINAEIDGEEIVYKDYFHIGVAVGTDRGLVVPVLRDADQMKFAEIEQGIRDLATKARDGKLSISDLQGGTFTITNGGVYGSMLSTPIINAPQSGILGMHSIQERPIALNGEVVIRPMMYLALTYDHRIVDGKEAVTFLVRMKENLENPERLMLDI